MLRGRLVVPNELLPGTYVMQGPPQISTSGGEGRAGIWIRWFAALRGYYKVTMRFCAGYNPLIIEGGITACPSPSEQSGLVIARKTAAARDREYGVALAP